MRFIRLYNIDIVAGAVASSCLAFKFLQQEIELAYLVCLALSVFIIYLTDHLLDATRISKKSESNRYFYYRNHKNPLQIVCGLCIIGLSVLVLVWLPDKQFKYGSITGSFIAIYLIINWLQSKINKYLLPRELIIAILYTSGTWGGALSNCDFKLSFTTTLYILSFASLVFTNTLIYAFFSFADDRADNVKSLAVVLGKEKVLQIVWFCLFISVAVMVYLLQSHLIYWFFCAIQLSMILALSMVIILRNKLEKDELYGKIADGAFLLPIFSQLA